jgi:hypothetical protein
MTDFQVSCVVCANVVAYCIGHLHGYRKGFAAAEAIWKNFAIDASEGWRRCAERLVSLMTEKP